MKWQNFVRIFIESNNKTSFIAALFRNFTFFFVIIIRKTFQGKIKV